MLGFSYDWDREIDTTDPDYVRWTQWIFLKLFERGLAYQSEVPVNWCPALGTVLANEEVINGLSERGGHPVERRAASAVDAQDHRLRGPAPRGPRSRRMARTAPASCSRNGSAAPKAPR